MKVESSYQTVKGNHNDKAFIFEDGYLIVANETYTKQCLQTLIEIANLLHHEGHKLRQKPPENTKSKADFTHSPWWHED